MNITVTPDHPSAARRAEQVASLRTAVSSAWRTMASGCCGHVPRRPVGSTDTYVAKGTGGEQAEFRDCIDRQGRKRMSLVFRWRSDTELRRSAADMLDQVGWLAVDTLGGFNAIKGNMPVRRTRPSVPPSRDPLQPALKQRRRPTAVLGVSRDQSRGAADAAQRVIPGCVGQRHEWVKAPTGALGVQACSRCGLLLEENGGQVLMFLTMNDTAQRQARIDEIRTRPDMLDPNSQVALRRYQRTWDASTARTPNLCNPQ